MKEYYGPVRYFDTIELAERAYRSNGYDVKAAINEGSIVIGPAPAGAKRDVNVRHASIVYPEPTPRQRRILAALARGNPVINESIELLPDGTERPI